MRAGAPSMVVSIAVEPGQKVQAGDPLGLLEAMKMEIGFDSPVTGTVSEVLVRKGQQVAAGEVMVMIEPATDDDGDSEASAPLELPIENDPLAVLFDTGELGQLGEPNLAQAAAASDEARRAAMFAVNDEIRRIVLGYDAFSKRVESLIRFLEAPIPEGLPQAFLQELAEVRSQLGVFADVEALFTRTQAASGTGEVDFSNNARLRMYVRRMRAKGAGLPEDFLAVVKRAVVHYEPGLAELEHSPLLERVMIRLFASQLEPALRFRLMMAVIKRVSNVAEAGVDLEVDTDLRRFLSRIALLRGQVSDALADTVIHASYQIFERPELDRQADQISHRLEAWIADPATGEAPPSDAIANLASLPTGRFRQIEDWLSASDDRRRALALAAYTRRLYAPEVPQSQATVDGYGCPVERLEFDGRVVLATTAPPKDAKATLLELNRLAAGDPVLALEAVIPVESLDEASELAAAIRDGFEGTLNAERLTLSMIAPDHSTEYVTLVSGEGGLSKLEELHGLHPRIARRLDFGRYQSFELERLNVSPSVYCFHGRSKAVPEDERVFVLAEVRGRPEGGQEAVHFIPAFERIFYEAARTLRTILRARDPRRHLQWNRLTFFVPYPIIAQPRIADELARKLHPATRHLGLERVAVRVKLVDPSAPDKEPRDVEVLISDVTGNRMDITWREPHTAPLEPVSEYVRRVVTAKRRGLIYPYEIIRMLSKEQEKAEGSSTVKGKRPSIPGGSFEEFDLDPGSASPKAVSVAGREPGSNQASVVFGIISTPTAKVPSGMERVLLLSDPTREMGALSKAECDRVVAAINLAEERGLPVEWLPVSSGARISMDSGTENLDATARVVRRIVTFTQSGGVIHVVVTGVNVGAQSYWDALATMLLHTRGVLIMTPRASMVLTGRAALKASGSVSAEDEVSIGGFERVMGPNGQAQYFAEDLADAYRILFEHYSYTYVVPGEGRPRPLKTGDAAARDVMTAPYKNAGDPFTTVGEIFRADTNPGRKRPFAMRCLMTAVADEDGGHLERWQAQVGAETAIVWDAHLGGEPVCLIGIESQNVARWGYRPLDGPADYNGGTLFPQSSKKVARALNAASGNRPAVILANLSGFDGSPESMRKLQLESGAEIARAVVNFDGPIVFLVVSRYHGGAYVVFSRELNPSLRALAVEGSYASVIGGGPAAAVVFPREVRARVSGDERVREARAALVPGSGATARGEFERVHHEVFLEKQAEVAAEFDSVHTVERALEVGSLEGIIKAKQIRPYLIQCVSRDTQAENAR